MWVVNIDTSKLVESYNIDRDSIRFVSEKVVNVLTWKVYNEIRELANDNLKQTRWTYKKGLNEPFFGPLTGTIVLTGTLANMIEQGATAFDMKEGLLKSAKAKEGKKGKYITVPFRWATPGSVGESEAFSNIIPSDIYLMIKGQEPVMTAFGGASKSGEGFNPKGTKHNTVLTRGAFQNLKTRKVFGSYTHKTPITQGIVKETSPYAAAMQSQYMSFRRVSLSSDKNSWVHPGLNARNFFARALQNIDFDAEAANVVRAYMIELGF